MDGGLRGGGRRTGHLHMPLSNLAFFGFTDRTKQKKFSTVYIYPLVGWSESDMQLSLHPISDFSMFQFDQYLLTLWPPTTFILHFVIFFTLNLTALVLRIFNFVIKKNVRHTFVRIEVQKIS